MADDFELTPYERAVAENKKRSSPIPRGYAWTPGTGPAGETCASCIHLVRKRMAKTYLKCALTAAKWTGGGSDVRARSPACAKWEARLPAPAKIAEAGE